MNAREFVTGTFMGSLGHRLGEIAKRLGEASKAIADLEIARQEIAQSKERNLPDDIGDLLMEMRKIREALETSKRAAASPQEAEMSRLVKEGLSSWQQTVKPKGSEADPNSQDDGWRYVGEGYSIPRVELKRRDGMVGTVRIGDAVDLTDIVALRLRPL